MTVNEFLLLLQAPLTIVLGAVFLRTLLPAPWHASYWLQPLAQGLVKKTLHRNRSISQQQLAGALGSGLLLVLALIIGASASLHALSQWLLLALLLPPRQLPGTDLVAALNVGNKNYVVQALTPYSRGELTNLSVLGLTKTAIEIQLERRASQFFGVIFWYAIGGIWLAVISFVASELGRDWTPQKPTLRAYGRPAYALAALFMLPINVLLGWFLCCYGSPSQAWQLRHQLQGNWAERSRQWLLLCFACSLGCQLGGPWQAQRQRIAAPRLGQQQSCQPAHLQRACRLLLLAQSFWLLVPLLIGFTFVVYHTLSA